MIKWAQNKVSQHKEICLTIPYPTKVMRSKMKIRQQRLIQVREFKLGRKRKSYRWTSLSSCTLKTSSRSWWTSSDYQMASSRRPIMWMMYPLPHIKRLRSWVWSRLVSSTLALAQNGSMSDLQRTFLPMLQTRKKSSASSANKLCISSCQPTYFTYQACESIFNYSDWSKRLNKKTSNMTG